MKLSEKKYGENTTITNCVCDTYQKQRYYVEYTEKYEILCEFHVMILDNKGNPSTVVRLFYFTEIRWY